MPPAERRVTSEPRPSLEALRAGEYKEAREKDLRGKVVVITGASRGIGRNIAIQAAQRGAWGMVITSTENSIDELQETAKIAHEAGAQVLTFNGDVSDPEHGALVIAQAVETFGQVNILVNNAAPLKDKLLLMVKKPSDLPAYHRPMDKYFGAVNFTHAALQAMRKRFSAFEKALPKGQEPSAEELTDNDGTIVFVSSVVAGRENDEFIGRAGQANYTAANAAIEAFAASTALEMDPKRGAKIVVVAPGWVNTRLTEPYAKVKAAEVAKLEGRDMEPEEMANEVLQAAVYGEHKQVYRIHS